MYIAQAFKGLHEWWRYLLGLAVVLVGWQLLGGIPFGIAIFLKTVNSENVINDLNQSDLLKVLDPNLNLFLMLFMFAVGLFVLFFVVVFMHRLSIIKLTTSRKKVDFNRIFFSFAVWAVLSIGILALDFYLAPENYVYNFKLAPFLVLCIIAIVMIPIQTSFEEYLFRGYLMQGIGVILKNKWAPLMITSIGFGLLHMANPEVEKLGSIIMVYYIGTGLFLGIITLMDEGLELALGFHAANNLFTALLVTSDWTALQTHSVLKNISDPKSLKLVEIFVPVFVIFPILLYVFSKKYEWSSWRKKLFGSVQKPSN